MQILILEIWCKNCQTVHRRNRRQGLCTDIKKKKRCGQCWSGHYPRWWFDRGEISELRILITAARGGVLQSTSKVTVLIGNTRLAVMGSNNANKASISCGSCASDWLMPLSMSGGGGGGRRSPNAIGGRSLAPSINFWENVCVWIVFVCVLMSPALSSFLTDISLRWNADQQP